MIKNEDSKSPPNFSAKYISLFNHNKAHYIKMLFPYDIKNLWKAEDSALTEFRVFLLDRCDYEFYAYMAEYEYNTYADKAESFFSILLLKTGDTTRFLNTDLFYYCLENIKFNEQEMVQILLDYIYFYSKFETSDSDIDEFIKIKKLLERKNFHINSSFHIKALDTLFNIGVHINGVESRFQHLFKFLIIIDQNLFKHENIHYQILSLLSKVFFKNLVSSPKPIHLFLSIVQFLKKEGLIINDTNSGTEFTVISEIANFITQKYETLESYIFSFFALQKIGFNLNVNIKLENDYIHTEGNFYDTLNQLGFDLISDLLKNQEIENEQLSLNHIFNPKIINTRL